MNHQPERLTRFTSSDIYRLMTLNKKGDGFGAPALSYIEEKRLEKRLGRSLTTDVHTRDIAWGNFMEKRVFYLLGDINWVHTGKDTFIHPNIPGWAGSPDLKAPTKIGDIKCFQPKNFAILTDAILKKDVQAFKESHPKEYWQLVSNCCIHGVDIAEIISYMPYQSELEEIRGMVENYCEPDQFKYEFIFRATDHELAYLPDGGYYQNLNSFEFEVPESDQLLLTATVLKAIELL